MFCDSFLSVSLWIRLCVSLGEFIFPVSLFIARRTSSELVMSEEQGLALTAWGTMVALGAEVTCTFEGKGISWLSLRPLCHDAPLMVGAHSVSGGFSPWM